MRQSVGKFAHRLPHNVLRYRALHNTQLVPLFLCDLHYHRNEVVGAAVVPEVDDEAVSFVFPSLESAVDFFAGGIHIEIAVLVGFDGEALIFCWQDHSVFIWFDFRFLWLLWLLRLFRVGFRIRS